jgi:hypothetical protein
MPTWADAIANSQQLYRTGQRTTPVVDLSPVKRVTGSSVSWRADTPQGTALRVYAKFTDSTEWTECVSGRSLPIIAEGQDLTGKAVHLRSVLESSGDKLSTPVLYLLQLRVRQADDPRVILGVQYGNVTSYRKVVDALAQKTVVYVGGEGENESRTILRLDTAMTGRKREVFLDANDTNDLSTLGERGLQQLADDALVDSYSMEATARQYVYGEEWDLGDYVTVVVPGAGERSLQVRRVVETYEEGRIGVLPEFGIPERTLRASLLGMGGRIARLETK